MKIIKPKFDIEIEEYTFLGRGPEATGEETGWQRLNDIFFRCIECGDMLQSTTNEDYQCQCGSMCIDADYHRFGSDHGDINVLVYESKSKN